jgi:hypothetical protein
MPFHAIPCAQPTRKCTSPSPPKKHLLVTNPFIVLSPLAALGQNHHRHTRRIRFSYCTRHARFLHVRNNGAVAVMRAPRTCKHFVVTYAERFDDEDVGDLLVGRRCRKGERSGSRRRTRGFGGRGAGRRVRGAQPGLAAPVVDGDEAVVDADCAVGKVVEKDYSSSAFFFSTFVLALDVLSCRLAG